MNIWCEFYENWNFNLLCVLGWIIGYVFWLKNGGIYFDDDELWLVSIILSIGEIYFFMVVFYEIGYVIGLEYVSDYFFVMLIYFIILKVKFLVLDIV